jgi:hypothetical protein
VLLVNGGVDDRSTRGVANAELLDVDRDRELLRGSGNVGYGDVGLRSEFDVAVGQKQLLGEGHKLWHQGGERGESVHGQAVGELGGLDVGGRSSSPDRRRGGAAPLGGKGADDLVGDSEVRGSRKTSLGPCDTLAIYCDV